MHKQVTLTSYSEALKQNKEGDEKGRQRFQFTVMPSIRPSVRFSHLSCWHKVSYFHSESEKGEGERERERGSAEEAFYAVSRRQTALRPSSSGPRSTAGRSQ